MQEWVNEKITKVHEELLALIKWHNTENNRKFNKIMKDSLTVPGIVEEFNPDAPYQALGKFLEENTAQVKKKFEDLETQL